MRNEWSLDAMPDLSGCIAVVTGANSGIGWVTARELARRNADVVLACRNPERADDAVRRIADELPGSRVESRALDLASQRSIRAFADGWDRPRLDLLVNNAGIAMVPFARTSDGFESQFGTNHLGSFALTGLLMPSLLTASAPRVVTVSSEGQRFARFDARNLNAERRFNAMFAYLQSKRANLYFAMHLQRLTDAAGVPLRSMAVAPGLTRTNVLTGGANSARGPLYQAFVRALIRMAFRPALEGAKTSLYAATVADLPGGSWVVPSGPFQLHGRPIVRPHEPALRHVSIAEDLWRRSEILTGVRYRFAPADTADLRLRSLRGRS